MKQYRFSGKKIIILFLLLFLVSNVTSHLSSNPQDSPARILGIPTITNTYTPLERCSIDQIVEDDSYIYILFGEHDGNVQVFDLNGNYQYSVYFYTHLNGAFSLAVRENVLYVRDEQKNLYIFCNGSFDSFISKEDAKKLLELLDFNDNSSNYTVRLGSVWRTNGNEDICIIKRPLISTLYQGDLMFFATLFIVLLFGLFYVFHKTSNTRHSGR